MTEKEKATEAANPSYTRDKSNDSSRKIQAVRKLFLSGGKFTAVEINRLCGFNDARKVISDLRNKEGLDIRDIRLSNGRKLYWLESRQRVITFKKGGAE